MEKTGKRKYILNLALLALVLLVLVKALGQDAPEIAASLQSISAAQVLLLLGMGLLYQLLEAGACHILLRERFPQVSYRQALCVILLGVFANVATFGAGTVPLQGYYLHRCGVPAGSGMGFMVVEYLLHKLCVVLFAVGSGVATKGWVWVQAPALRGYLLYGLALNLCISLGLALLCSWGRLKNLALRLVGRLPSGGKWAERRAMLARNVESLYTDSGRLLRSRRTCGRAMLLTLLKLAVLYLIPPLCLRMIAGAALPVGQGVALSAAALLLTGALPNVAGVGSLELAFMLVFSCFVPRGKASSALVLYRAATYFFPLLLGVGAFLHFQKGKKHGA